MKKLFRSLGSVLAVHQRENGMLLCTDEAEVNITVYSDSIIRVFIEKTENEARELPYAVVAEPEKTTVEFKETEDIIFLKTRKIRMLVSRNPLRISFTDSNGKFLNEDDCALGTGWMGDTVATYKAAIPGERFIGLGEKNGPLDRAGKAYTQWNTDHFAYPTDADPIYLSTPFYMGIHSDGHYGIFLNNSHRSVMNFGASNDRFSSFQAEGGPMDYFFFHNDTVVDMVSDHSWLTGRIPLPPKWALGFQQCRYSYYPEAEVRNLARTFREKKIPADVIYLDIHYMKDYKVFTFDENRFPDPKKMTSDLDELGFKTVVIVDPGVKRELGYDACEDGMKKDVFVKYPDGKPYAAQVWPGWSYFPDFTKESARNWWSEKMKFYTDRGVRGFWNDMNEPASWGQMTPDLIEFDWENDPTTHSEARNVYGALMSRATKEGADKHLDNKRPLMLTRAGFSGVQRYAAVWTGDNIASDEHMLAGVRLINSMGLTGIPFAGYDVGGFQGDASAKLFARWISIGAFSPFFRAHSMINSKDAEPWAFGETAEAIARNYINLRYRLMPTIYTAMHRATQDGMPLVRSLALFHPTDEQIYRPEYQNQYMFGESLLICPVESTNELTRVYLPQGDWYDLYSDKHYTGGQEIVVDCPIDRLPIFVKRGAPIITQSQVQSTSEKHDGVMSLHVWFKAQGTACIYEDDGESYDFEKGKSSSRMISYDCLNNTISFGSQEGDYASDFKKVKVIWHGFQDRKVMTASVKGMVLEAESEEHRWLDQLPSFDPFESGGIDHHCHVFSVEFENSGNAFDLIWQSQLLNP
jgi:alpha-glucosidase